MKARIPSTRPGVTLPELLLVSWLFCLVLLGLARFASAQGRLARATHDRARAADLIRTAAIVLRGELRHVAPPDLRVTPDSVRLRAVRGAGVICGRDGSVIRVAYRGLRWPDPAKDSVLVISDSSTAGRPYGVVDVVGTEGGDGCGEGYRVTVDGTPPNAGLVLVFETGSYHLTDGALRYRRGRGGRQPLTETVLRQGDFRWTPGGLLARMVLHDDSLATAGGPELGARVGILNRAPP